MKKENNFVSKESQLERQQRLSALIMKAKHYLDTILLSDKSNEEKMEAAANIPEDDNDAIIVADFAVFMDNIKQSAPSEDQFLSWVDALSQMAHDGTLFKILMDSVNKYRKGRI